MIVRDPLALKSVIARLLFQNPTSPKRLGFCFFDFDRGAIFLGFCFNLRGKQHLRDTISFFVSSDPGDLRWPPGEADASGARRDLPVVLKDCVTRFSILDLLSMKRHEKIAAPRPAIPFSISRRVGRLAAIFRLLATVSKLRADQAVG